jgi:hypothetical protein
MYVYCTGIVLYYCIVYDTVKIVPMSSRMYVLLRMHVRISWCGVAWWVGVGVDGVSVFRFKGTIIMYARDW